MRCSWHPDRITQTRCALCGKPACAPCLDQAEAPGHCATCAPAAARALKATPAVPRPAPIHPDTSGRPHRRPTRMLWLSPLLLLLALAGWGWRARSRPLPSLDQWALSALAEAAARVQLQRLESGSWPTTDEVELPPDPFGDGALQLVASTRGGLLLYSVGPDGTDQRGRPWDAASGEGDLVLPLY